MNMRIASILCLVIMLAGCVAGQQRGLVGDTYVSSSQPALALKARDLPLMGSTMGASRLTSSGAMGGLLVDSWVTVYGKGDGASPLAIVAHGEVPDGWYWDGIMRHPFSINEGVETIGGVEFVGINTDKQALDVSSAFCESDLCYTYPEYVTHLQETARFAAAHPNYTLKRTAAQAFRNLQIFLREGQWAMVSKGKAPAIHFVIRHPRLREAMEQFIPPVVE